MSINNVSSFDDNKLQIVTTEFVNTTMLVPRQYGYRMSDEFETLYNDGHSREITFQKGVGLIQYILRKGNGDDKRIIRETLECGNSITVDGKLIDHKDIIAHLKGNVQPGDTNPVKVAPMASEANSSPNSNAKKALSNVRAKRLQPSRKQLAPYKGEPHKPGFDPEDGSHMQGATKPPTEQNHLTDTVGTIETIDLETYDPLKDLL